METTYISPRLKFHSLLTGRAYLLHTSGDVNPNVEGPTPEDEEEG